MKLLTPPGREEAFIERAEGRALVRYRRELEGSELARRLDKPGELLRLPGAEIIAAHANRLAAVPLGEGDALPARGFVKAFGGRGLFSRLRSPRAARAWNVACELLRLGVPTPEPVAISLPGPGEWREGALVVEFIAGAQVRDYVNPMHVGGELPRGRSAEAFAAHLGRFVRSFHDAGAFHGDLGGGNILVTEPACASSEANGLAPPGFALVDVTRCRVGRSPNRLERLRDLARIKVPEVFRGALVEAYSEAEPRIANLAGQDGLTHPLYRAKLRLKRSLRRFLNPILGSRGGGGDRPPSTPDQ